MLPVKPFYLSDIIIDAENGVIQDARTECFLYQYKICLDVGRHYFKQLLLISG